MRKNVANKNKQKTVAAATTPTKKSENKKTNS